MEIEDEIHRHSKHQCQRHRNQQRGRFQDWTNPDHLNLNLAEYKAQQELSQGDAKQRSKHGEHQILLEHILRRLAGGKAQHLDGGNLPDALVDVDVGQIIQHNHRQDSGTDDHHYHHQIQGGHHGINHFRKLLAHRNIGNAILLVCRHTCHAGVFPLPDGNHRHLLLGRFPPLGSDGFGRYNGIIIDMVFINAGNGHVQSLHIRVVQNDPIPCFHSQNIRHAR